MRGSSQAELAAWRGVLHNRRKFRKNNFMSVLVTPRTLIKNLFMGGTFSFLVFVPSALMIFLGASSFGLGVLSFSGLIIALFFIFFSNKKLTFKLPDLVVFVLLFFCFCLVVVHYVFVNQLLLVQNNADDVRFFYGLISIVIVLIAAYCASKMSYCIPDKSMVSIVNFALFFMLLNVLMSSFRVDFFGVGNIKPSFLFMEPSHIALAASSLIMFAAVTKKSLVSLVIISLVMAWGLYVENLTTMIVGLMSLVVRARIRLIYFSVVICIAIALCSQYLDADDFKYFSERLNFASGSENLSVLVLMQGWENAVMTLQSTSGFGAGFQQLGVSTEVGDYTQRVIDIVGSDPNKFDGGTTASKLVAELGYAGVLLLFIQAYLMLYSFIRIRRYSLGMVMRPCKVFAHCIIICSFLELYVRGVGYFSPTMFLFFTAIFLLFLNRDRPGVSSRSTLDERHTVQSL